MHVTNISVNILVLGIYIITYLSVHAFVLTQYNPWLRVLHYKYWVCMRQRQREWVHAWKCGCLPKDIINDHNKGLQSTPWLPVPVGSTKFYVINNSKFHTIIYNDIQNLNKYIYIESFINYTVILIFIVLYIWFRYDLGQKYYAPQVWPDQGSNSWPPDHDSTFHVTEMPALTTRPSVTSFMSLKCLL